MDEHNEEKCNGCDYDEASGIHDAVLHRFCDYSARVTIPFADDVNYVCDTITESS